MKLGIAVLALLGLCANAMAGPEQYAVDGITLGTQLNFASASYHEYKCSPSEQFDGFTWCQKARSDKERRGRNAVGYSLLHSRTGNVVYVNRSQEPSFLKADEAERDLQRYASKIGETPRIMKMPHRSGVSDGLIATWGKITLVPLDQKSVKVLAEGKRPKKGLLIDWLGNFERSAREGLPIYRIDGGPGFVWLASFDQKGRGILRLAAVDASAFSFPPSSPMPYPTSQPTADTSEPESSQVEATADTSEQNSSQLEPTQTIEKLRAELAVAASRIAELEQSKAAAEAALKEATKARIDAETARSEIEQAGTTEKGKSEATIPHPEGKEATASAQSTWWEKTLYGSMSGLLVALTVSAVGFASRRRAPKFGTTPILALAPSQVSETEVAVVAASPAIAIAEDVFGRELEAQVAAINATQAEIEGAHALHLEANASSAAEVSP
jgi:hypothetical protein